MDNCIDHGRKGNKQGYATGRYKGKCMGLHRIVFVEHYGYFPAVVRHTCDNPRCINPEHLIGGTQSDNVQDRVVRGRGAIQRGEQHGRAKLSNETVEIIKRRYIPKCPVNGGAALAKEFNVHQGTISKIMTGKSWET